MFINTEADVCHDGGAGGVWAGHGPGGGGLQVLVHSYVVEMLHVDITCIETEEQSYRSSPDPNL